jgi:hypothetical protein
MLTDGRDASCSEPGTPETEITSRNLGFLPGTVQHVSAGQERRPHLRHRGNIQFPRFQCYVSANCKYPNGAEAPGSRTIGQSAGGAVPAEVQHHPLLFLLRARKPPRSRTKSFCAGVSNSVTTPNWVSTNADPVKPGSSIWTNESRTPPSPISAPTTRKLSCPPPQIGMDRGKSGAISSGSQSSRSRGIRSVAPLSLSILPPSDGVNE